MRVHVVSNLRDGKGLARDARLLEAALTAMGHEVRCWPLEHAKAPPTADLVVFLERVAPVFLKAAPRRWLVPNPEWWRPAEEACLPAIERVLCKTHDALRLLAGRHAAAIYTGFLSEDALDAAVPRERRFLHVAGASPMKGTQAVLGAWHLAHLRSENEIRGRVVPFARRPSAGLPPRLDVVCSIPIAAPPPGVHVHRHLSTAALRTLQNACRFHLCPSRYEGFGHTIHEALSVGACVATTDAPPMNEWGGCAAWIPPVARERQGLATLADVDAEGVLAAVDEMGAWPDARLDLLGLRARQASLDGCAVFVERLRALF